MELILVRANFLRGSRSRQKAFDRFDNSALLVRCDMGKHWQRYDLASDSFRHREIPPLVPQTLVGLLQV